MMRNRVLRESASSFALATPIAACSSSGATTAPDAGEPDAAGSYRIALRVTDAQGAVGDPAYLEIEVED
ncbi:MAG: hypothetical protein JRE81_01275 [Deltaproteobacteria bacterium]|nr:hypothetical protein [Deltaproteobacteria bacterium]